MRTLRSTIIRRFRGIWGLKWTFDPEAKPGRRTISLVHADGSSLDETQRLAVAFNSYDLAGGGQRWKRLRELVNRPEARLVEYDFQTRGSGHQLHPQARHDYANPSQLVDGEAWFQDRAGTEKRIRSTGGASFHRARLFRERSFVFHCRI